MRWIGTSFAVAASSALAFAGETHLTIYNQDFAVVRDDVPLSLKPGANRVRFTETTAHLEPDSVILRDPTGKHALQILEQNYRADPISQELLLSLFEGRSIPFLVTVGDKQEQKTGRIVRSGYQPHASGLSRYGQDYYQTQMQRAYGGGGQPIIEMDGALRFGLPGLPLFPSLGDDTILEPSIDWVIETDAASSFTAELCYVTGGMGWQADYNVVSPEIGDVLDLVGWVTVDNQSGKTFTDARLKLMAGDVNKLVTSNGRQGMNARAEMVAASGPMGPPVTEKSFDEFHLYSIARATTVRDRETKQIEFVRSSGVASQRIYVYDGTFVDPNQRNWDADSIRSNESYGSKSNPKVWVMRELVNSDANRLGIALPKGRVRFYRRDADGQLEFVGENLIDHTPKDETLRIYTGNAFDVVGERTRTDFKRGDQFVDESFEIELRNHKKEAVEIRVVEHLYRWVNWEISMKSDDYRKTDAQAIEFRITVPADGVRKVSYRAHYTW